MHRHQKSRVGLPYRPDIPIVARSFEDENRPRSVPFREKHFTLWVDLKVSKRAQTGHAPFPVNSRSPDFPPFIIRSKPFDICWPCAIEQVPPARFRSSRASRAVVAFGSGSIPLFGVPVDLYYYYYYYYAVA